MTVSRRTKCLPKVLDLRQLLVHSLSSFFLPTPSIFAMEYHAVPPEERARDEKGNLLPWGYVYKE